MHAGFERHFKHQHENSWLHAFYFRARSVDHLWPAYAREPEDESLEARGIGRLPKIEPSIRSAPFGWLFRMTLLGQVTPLINRHSSFLRTGS